VWLARSGALDATAKESCRAAATRQPRRLAPRSTLVAAVVVAAADAPGSASQYLQQLAAAVARQQSDALSLHQPESLPPTSQRLRQAHCAAAFQRLRAD